MQGVRVYEIPDCKMVSSGVGMFGQEKFENFAAWFSALPRGICPKDFLFWDDGSRSCSDHSGGPGLHWLYLYEPGMDVPQDYRVIDFKGGLYAVATDVDQKTDMDALNAQVDQFLSENGLERDPSRPELGNVITPPLAQKAMGYEQMDYYSPIHVK